MAKQKRALKQSTKSDLITYAMLAVAFVFVEVLTLTGNASNKFTGLLVPLCYYSILAVSLNLVVGILGDLSLGHAGFMCIGAYSSALFSVAFKDTITQDWLRFLIALLIGGILAGIFGFLIGIPVLRLKGDYLAIVTLAFGEIIKNIVNLLYVGLDSNGLHISLASPDAFQLEPDGKLLINGALGITGTPHNSNFIIGFVLLVITVFVSLNLINSRTGRAVMSIRDNRIAAESVGINVTKYKLIVFSVSAFFAGIAGVLYAHNLSSLTATTKNFGYNMSIMILVFVVLGGIGSTRGSIIAAVILTALPEVLRGLNDYRMLIYAIVLILLMLANNNEKLNAFKEKISISNLFKNKKAGNTLDKEANS
ncbi:MAG: branched-chain amino acid ABC transporter permease [Candidatus Fimenecus sp.]